jgi:hypothetical protein
MAATCWRHPAGGGAAVDRLRPYGFLLLYALMLTGVLGAIVRPPYFLSSVGWLL